MLKLVIGISIVCLQLLSINAKEDGIQLGWMASGELVNWGACDREGRWMETDGAFAHSYYTVHSESSAKCMTGQWVLDWDKEDLGKQQNNQNCLPVSSLNRNGECMTCPCVDSDSLNSENVFGLNRFSLRAQESDVANNKVITGVKFVAGSRVVHLQIKQATLQSNKEVKDDAEWVPIPVKNAGDYEMGERNVNDDEFLVTWDKRTVHLDEIIVPFEFAITGVRFAPIESGKGIKLEVRGTGYDNSGKLDIESHKWYDGIQSYSEGEAYYRPRNEVVLKDAQDSSLAPENTGIMETNMFVRFRAATVTEKMIFPTIPRLNTTAAEAESKALPQGIQLSYHGHPGYGGYLSLKMIPIPYIDPLDGNI